MFVFLPENNMAYTCSFMENGLLVSNGLHFVAFGENVFGHNMKNFHQEIFIQNYKVK